LDYQSRYVDGLQVVAVDIRVADERVEVDTLGTDGEKTIDEFGHGPNVLPTHDEPFGNPATRRTIIDGAKVHSSHRGSCRLNCFTKDGSTTAVGLPGRLPTRRARCFTLSG
jgi:hypothetical protein